jgi:hypothetical protein
VHPLILNEDSPWDMEQLAMITEGCINKDCLEVGNNLWHTISIFPSRFVISDKFDNNPLPPTEVERCFINP